jgi:hypothetical protein
MSDELFDVMINIQFALKLQNRSYSQLQFTSPQFITGFRIVQSGPRAPDKALVCV